jgi:hypothetical protein
LSEQDAEVDWAEKMMGPWIVLGISGGGIDENQVNRFVVVTTWSITIRSGLEGEKRIPLPQNHILL